MTYTILFIIILVVHWFADFVCQTDEQAKGKSTSIKYLLYHTGTYTFVWAMSLMDTFFTFPELQMNVLLFLGITFVTHTIIDFFTSKLNSYLWREGKMHEFFVSIGFDQVLHYVILWFSFTLLLMK